MYFTHNKLLLILPPNDHNAAQMREILKTRGFEILTASNLVSAIQMLSEFAPELVICHKQVQEHSGFRIFTALQPVLSPQDIPFMLYLDEFNKDDVLIGLEMGIDNFIINPFDNDSLIKRIVKQLRKSQNNRILETDRFKIYFETTPVAKFITENEQLSNLNEAFSKVTGTGKDADPLPKISELFDFSCNEQNRLNFRKCMNGIKEYCLFNSVPLIADRSVLFDIHMVYNDYFGKNIFTGEIIKVENTVALNGNNHSDNQNSKSEVALTQREKQVLELSSKGYSIKQIASQLGVSARTVEKHRANIMEKTKSSNIIEAIYYLQD